MKLLLVAVLAQAALGAWVDVDEWAQFKLTHSKVYEDQFSELKHMKTYAVNKAYIAKHNAEADAGEHSYWLAVNRFADMTNEEFRAQMNGYKPSRAWLEGGRPHRRSGQAPPDSRDWRDEGAVTGVKDQGQCGSCWAFSTTGSLEGVWALAGNELVSLSEQQIMDCSYDFGNNACQGGEMRYAFKYLIKNGGIMSEADYGYNARTEHKCKYDASKAVAHCSDTVIIQTKDEADLMDAVGNVGPVAVGMDASHADFQLYSHGIYSHRHCKTALEQLDHGVLAVGYGSEGGENYWIVKNSWGPGWGEDGFFRMAKDAGNMCGIATDCVYPII